MTASGDEVDAVVASLPVFPALLLAEEPQPYRAAVMTSARKGMFSLLFI